MPAMFAGHTIVGGVVSFTVTVNEHIAVFGVGVAVSVAVHVTVVTPSGNVEPDGGTHTAVTPGQLSVAVGAYVATAVHAGPADKVWFAGQVIVGGSVSFTVTVNVHVAMLLDASVAVHVTVVTPFAKAVPEAGTHAAVAPGQLSPGVGVV